MPPVCNFTYSPAANLTTSDVITFISNSVDADGTIASSAWDFGDGNIATGATVTHRYTNHGMYLVSLTVTDGGGSTDSCSKPITISDTPPICSFTYSPDNPRVGDYVFFDGRGSYDIDGTIPSWFWSFGDNNTGTGSFASHRYTNIGNYTVILTVIDDDGNTASCNTSIIVASMHSPICNFTYSPTNPTTSDTITFDSTSTDPDGTIASSAWDFDDGNTGSGDPATHRFATIGTFNIWLTVTDNTGNAVSCNTSVIVSPAPKFEIPLSSGWHLISLPVEPIDPDPKEVFKDKNGSYIPISGNLHRYDHSNQRYVTYYDFLPYDFGPCKRGDGYWLYLFQNSTISYEGFPTQKSFSLPTAGWYLIGGITSNTSMVNIQLRIYDSIHSQWITKNFSEVKDVWIQDPFIGYDNSGSRYFSAGLKGTDEDNYLRPWNGYWVYTFANNVEIILP
jgi:PKD repeat protein